MNQLAFLTAGPAALPVSLQATPEVVVGGGHVRDVRLGGDLTGHRAGTVHAGVVAGIALAAAQAEDPHRVPVTSLDGTVASVPTADLTTHATPVPTARHDVTVRTGDHVRARFEIELAGHASPPQVADLRELAARPLPDVAAEPAHTICALCGPDGRLRRAPSPRDGLVEGVLAPGEEACGPDDRVHLTVLLAAMACASAWVTGREATGLHLRLTAVPMGYEPLRLIAADDPVGGTRVLATDEDATVFAVLATTTD
jgi:hypothetical protein